MRVLRCEACAGPLPPGDGMVVCRYCGCAHRVDQRMDGILRAAAEARELVSWVQAREPLLQAEAEAIRTRVFAGERDLIPRALELQEGIVRLGYAPTLHFLRAMMGTDPNAERMRREIEEVVQKVVESWREVFTRQATR